MSLAAGAAAAFVGMACWSASSTTRQHAGTAPRRAARASAATPGTPPGRPPRARPATSRCGVRSRPAQQAGARAAAGRVGRDGRRAQAEMAAAGEPLRHHEAGRAAARARDACANGSSSTPEQRELARETYTRAQASRPSQKTASWESYQQLPEDQKSKLAAVRRRRARRPAVVPSQASGKVVAPLGQGATSCPPAPSRTPSPRPRPAWPCRRHRSRRRALRRQPAPRQAAQSAASRKSRCRPTGASLQNA